LEGLLARDLLDGSLTKSDSFKELTDINRHGSIDVIRKFEQLTYDIDKAVNHTLKPLYQELYASHDDCDERVSRQCRIATNALHRAKALLESYAVKNKAVPLLQLENLFEGLVASGLQRSSRHVTISISGFLSQSDTMTQGWRQLADHLSPTSTACFALRWESKKQEDLWAATGKLGLGIGAHVALTYATGGAITLLRGALLGAQVSKEYHGIFDDTKRMAKFSGCLLGCMLAIGYPFYSQSVSLLGFSLGCQVIKSCLKTMHKLEANDVIHNVTFMGAAIDLPDKNKSEKLWSQILSTTVSGLITNAYTKGDAVLLLYSAS
jgi:hypothetical protein